MNRLLVLTTVLLLGGCASLSGPLTGQLETGAETFTGSIAETLTGGTLTLKTSTGATCDGTFDSFAHPQDGYAAANGLLKCSDGRSGTFHIVASFGSKTTGTGDLGGQRITFTAG